MDDPDRNWPVLSDISVLALASGQGEKENAKQPEAEFPL
jgi:hypothetical protein